MEWLRAEIEFASAFSYRMPGTSSQFGIPCLLPGPSTVKLALVSTAISYYGSLLKGKKIFEIVRNAEVRFLIPEKIAVFTPLIKRLKAKKEGGGFETTYGTRGYVLFSQPLILYIGMPNICSNDCLEEVSKVLRVLRRLGTSDSLLSVLKVSNDAPENDFSVIGPVSKISETSRGGILQIVDDFHEEATFEQINIYETSIPKREKEKALVRKYYIIPVKTVKKGGNWILYSRITVKY